MVFSKSTLVILTLFLNTLHVFAAPLLTPRATADVSASYAGLSKPIVSPYYVYFGNLQTQKLADAFDSLKLRSATVGFGSAPKGKCQLGTDLDGLVDDVQAFIAKGGAISLSFGGNLQDQTDPRQHVQQACTDVPSLTKLFLDAMSKFFTSNLEIDIEDNSLLSDLKAAQRLAQALVEVKKKNPDTFVTYTVSTNTKGMPKQQIAWVQAAKDNGLTIDQLVLMTMNMGGKDNVKDSQTAISGGATQLASIYSISNDDAMKKMGMLPAIGIDNDRLFVDLAGITTLGQFTKSQGMTSISFWNFNRDFPGGIGVSQQVLNVSSSPDQKTPSQFFTTLLDSLEGTNSNIVKGAIAIKVIEPSAQALPPPSNKQPKQKASLPPANPDETPENLDETPAEGSDTLEDQTATIKPQKPAVEPTKSSSLPGSDDTPPDDGSASAPEGEPDTAV